MTGRDDHCGLAAPAPAGAGPAPVSMWSALRWPGFRWVAAVYAFDYVVELASSIALMVLVFDRTDSALVAALMLLCKQVVPGALATLLARLLEHTTVRIGLVAAYGISAIALGVLALAGYGVVLFAVAVVAGTSGAAVRSLLRTAVARTERGARLRAANGMLNVIMGIVALVGPAVGAMLVTAVGVQEAIAAAAAGALLLACAAFLMPVSLRGARAGEDDEDEVDEAGASPEVGPAGGRARPVALLAVGGLLIGLFAMDEPALLAYAERSLGSGVGGYGAILGAWGAGMIAGSLVYGGVLGRPMAMLFAAGAAVNAIGYVGLGVAPSLLVACLVAVIGGAGNGILWVALVTAIQEAAGPDEQATFAGRLEGVATATPAVGILAGGLVADAFDPRVSLLAPGLLALGVVAAWVVSERPAGPAEPERARSAA